MLTEAAERLDLLHGHLGPDGKVEPSEEGNIARDAMDKEAKLAAFPDVYKITDQDYLARRWKESRTLHLAAVLNCV